MKGVWRYGADPSDGDARTLIQGVDSSGRLVADVEGMTLIRDETGTYLVVSSQGDSAFVVWRVSGGSPAYIGRFRVAAANGIDGVSGTDGIDAYSGAIGPYPSGLLVMQDDQNEGMTQNFKLVDWRAVRGALKID
jgi:3-phytase